ncbi:hypothetical protein GQX74_014495 [Glossina fuscipes]|nr:hypothetical protein GQX74_014495 [Glossina fuscipes]
MYIEYMMSAFIFRKVLLMIDNTSHDVRPDKRLLPIISIDGNLSIDILRTVNEAVLLMQPVTEDRSLTAYFAVRGGRVDVTVALLVLKRILLEPFCNIKLCVNCMPDCCKFARNDVIVFEPHVVLLAASRVLLDDISCILNSICLVVVDDVDDMLASKSISEARSIKSSSAEFDETIIIHEVSGLPDYCTTKYSCNNCGNALSRLRQSFAVNDLDIRIQDSGLKNYFTLISCTASNVEVLDLIRLIGFETILSLILALPREGSEVSVDGRTEPVLIVNNFLSSAPYE